MIKMVGTPACRKGRIGAQPGGVGTFGVATCRKERIRTQPCGVGAFGVPACRKEGGDWNQAW